MRAISLLLAAVLASCTPSSAPSSSPSEGAATSAAHRAKAPVPTAAAAIAHGGVGSPPEYADGCRAAVDVALRALASGADPADAAVAGVVVMEDDPRFNAGTGSAVRLDAKSVQMDASVMRSDGRFGAVAGIEEVQNPVKVARAVMDTPNLLLQGDGATRFARTLGFPPYDPTTPRRVDQARALRQELLDGDPSLPADWRSFDLRARWNYATPFEGSDAGVSPATRDAGHDTVGVAVRGADGRFAVALSTGGYALALRGRVGDVPILGAGLYAGAAGASAATGTGERVIEEGLAREVHGWLADGAAPREAAERAVERLKGKGGEIGIIVMGATEMAAAADRPMAWAGREEGAAEWKGP